MSNYIMITNNIVTATSRKTATYFIRTEIAKNIPNLNELGESYLSNFADFVVRNGQLVKAKHDITGLLVKALLT